MALPQLDVRLMLFSNWKVTKKGSLGFLFLWSGPVQANQQKQIVLVSPVQVGEDKKVAIPPTL